MSEKNVRVGVGVIIIKDGKVLMQKRKGSHGEGTWSFPGGHLEFKESIEECAIREVNEEVGINIKNIGIATFTNDIFVKEDKHYITIFVKADYDSGDPHIKEPDKIEKLGWFNLDSLPNSLFMPIQNLIRQGYDLGAKNEHK